MDDTFEISLSNVSNISNFSEEKSERNVGDRDAIIQGLMRLYLRHKLTKVAVEDIAKLINCVPGAKIQLPMTFQQTTRIRFETIRNSF